MLGLRHGVSFISALALRRPDVCYVPIARSRIAFLRDCLFSSRPALRAARSSSISTRASSSVSTMPSRHGCARSSDLRSRGNTRVVVLGESLRDAFGPLVPDRARERRSERNPRSRHRTIGRPPPPNGLRRVVPPPRERNIRSARCRRPSRDVEGIQFVCAGDWSEHPSAPKPLVRPRAIARGNASTSSGRSRAPRRSGSSRRRRCCCSHRHTLTKAIHSW